MSGFKWTPKRSEVAVLLANGHTQVDAAAEAGVTDRTIRRWLQDETFSAEVDRLSLMTDIASRAERLRLAKRMVRQLTQPGGALISRADLLDWLKFAQSETDGIKLDLTALLAAQAPLADPGSAGAGGDDERGDN